MVDRGDLLTVVARHDLFIDGQVAQLRAWPLEEIDMALDGLVAEGLLGRVRLWRTAPRCYWITESGLAAIDSDLAAPVFELGDVRRLLAATTVWTWAGDGRIRGARAVLSAREQHAVDRARSARGEQGRTLEGPFGLRAAGGATRRDAGGAHYPDVLIRVARGLIAVEIVLGLVTGRRLRGVLSAYGSDARYSRVVFLVEEERIARQIETAAGTLGLADLVVAQWSSFVARGQPGPGVKGP